MPDRPDSREGLAVQRTVLANERTLLAFARTAIALVAAGASSIHFLGGAVFDVLGWALVAARVTVQAVGVVRYRRVRALLRATSSTESRAP